MLNHPTYSRTQKKSSQDKYVHQYNTSVTHDHHTQSSSTTRGHSMRYNTAGGQNKHIIILHSFPSTIRLWNSLPEKMVSSPDFNRFKTFIFYIFNLLYLYTYMHGIPIQSEPQLYLNSESCTLSYSMVVLYNY